jgi:hypothetical protein
MMREDELVILEVSCRAELPLFRRTDEETNVRLHLHACALERSLSRSTRRASPWIQKKME